MELIGDGSKLGELTGIGGAREFLAGSDIAMAESQSGKDVPLDAAEPLEEEGAPVLAVPHGLATMAGAIADAEEFVTSPRGVKHEGEAVAVFHQVQYAAEAQAVGLHW